MNAVPARPANMAGRKRIVIVSPDPLEDGQGVERFCHTLAGVLSAAGYDARVVGPDGDVDDADLVVTNAMVSVRTRRPRLHVYHGCAIPQIRKSHAESSRRWRAKFMVVGSWREWRAGWGAERVSVSASCAREIRRYYRMKSTVIPNGVDTSIFAPSNRKVGRENLGVDDSQKVALFVGRPEWRKRPDIALKAAADNGYKVYLAAGGPFPGMSWLGKLDPAQLAQVLSAVDVVLMPTQYEACSLAFLEAVAVGSPVITTDAGWVPELVEHVPSYSVLVSPVGDSDAFSRSLGRLESEGREPAEQAARFVRSHNDLAAFGRSWRMHVERIIGAPTQGTVS